MQTQEIDRDLLEMEWNREKKQKLSSDGLMKQGSKKMDHNYNLIQDVFVSLAQIAVKALIYEVSVTPKPGLVDRYNNGAHRDMDFYTFIDSAQSLFSYFHEAVQRGYEFKGTDVRILFRSIRSPGMEAERTMFRATCGVNTHKGLIFSFGILFCCAGCLYGRGERVNYKSLSLMAKDMTRGLTSEDFKHVDIETASTNGERLYAIYGITGIRGEAEKGFITAIDKGYPVFTKALKMGYSMNDAGIMALFSIMEVLDDTNVLARHNFETLNYVKECAEKLNKIESLPQFITEVSSLDQEFIQKNISPGGAADILAITIAIYMIETEFAGSV